MRIGMLNRQVSLQRKVLAQDQETEALVESWVEVAKVWANVRYLNGTETIKAATPTSIAKASIKIRFRKDVEATWRAVDGAVIFNILNVLPDAEGREHVFLACETGGNNG